MDFKKRNILFVIVFLLLGLFVARVFLEKDITLNNFYTKFDVLMHLLMIIGFFIIAISKNKVKE